MLRSFTSRSAALLLLLLQPVSLAFVLSPAKRVPAASPSATAVVVALSETASDFSSFADSLEEEPTFSDQGGDDEPPTWQAKLESLLDPRTSVAQKQTLASELLSSNKEIQDSVLSALRDRKIDPLLTPTGKKLQEGTKAVARQLTNDILPRALPNSPSSSSSSPLSPLSPPQELIDNVPKIGSRILNALGNQARKQLEQVQGDLANPTRIPERVSKQTQDLVQEAKNVFMETPEGLEGPAYTVVASTNDYEIRDYEGYTVASTNMAKLGEPYSMEDLASGGAAFNALAAYLFGANSEGKAMDMTTPVTTTSLGEMRFYLKGDGVSMFPEPLVDDNLYDTGSIQLVDIPPARLAVRRFTGFVTDGEVARQKDVLLQSLQLDGTWELDVAHGAIVPHVIFQYNPPYTLPMIRRNEIAVPIRTEDESAAQEWTRTTTSSSSGETTDDMYDDADVSPSDY